MKAFIAAERGRFVLWLPVAMFAGVLCYFSLTFEPPGWPGAVGFMTFAALAWLTRHRPAPFAASLLLASVAAGFAAGSAATWRAAPIDPLPRRAIILEGVVGLVEKLPDGRRITVEHPAWAGQGPLRRSVRVRLHRGDATEISVGDLVRVRALLRPSPMPAWPGAWDLQRDAFFANRAGGGTALGVVEVIGRVQAGGAALWWQGLRQRLAERVLQDLPGPVGAVAATLFTGLSGTIGADDRAAFRDAGLAHLLAVAGLHIGAVMGAVFAVARLLLACSATAALRWPWACKQVAGLAALAAGLLYLLLTGVHLPIERSFAMATLATLGLLTGRRALSLRGLAMAAVVILVTSPEAAVDVSFQLSFSAVMALIAGYEMLRPWLARLHGAAWWRRIAQHVAALTLTSLLAGGATLPIAAYHFGQIQLWFVAANLVAVPLTAFIALPAGIVALLLMPFGLEQAALQPMGWALTAVIHVAHGVAGWPAATLRVPQMPNWGALCVGAGLCWLCLWRGGVRFGGVVPLTIGLASLALLSPPDLLVSSDARLIGLRTPDGVWLQSRGGDRFTSESWAQAWGVRSADKLSAAPDDGVSCDRDGCLLRPRIGGPAVLLSAAGAPSAACHDVVLVVSAQPARNACRGVPLIDRFTVWRDGAYAVWLRPGRPIILSDRAIRGARPWVPGPPNGRGEVPRLPMAQVEGL